MPGTMRRGGEMLSECHIVCCFCAAPIPDLGPHPILLQLAFKDGGSQQLWAHPRCFRRVLHPSVYLGVRSRSAG